MISERFRQSMGWLHTWLGIALSAVLFAVFWTGTLTVFDKEIDQWMKPELRIASADNVSLDSLVLQRVATFDTGPDSVIWIGPPRDRQSVIRLFYDDAAGESHEELIDPHNGKLIKPTDSDAGEFFFRFHFMLHLPDGIGYYVVGLAALGMMILIISGIFIHRKIFQEFFTFRPKKRARRAVLDFHNLTGVIALPFHFLIPFSGLLILATTYLPWSMGVPYQGDLKQLRTDQLGYEERKIEPAGVPGGAIAAIDRYRDRAEAIWRSEEGRASSSAEWIAIFNPKDANAYVMIERYFPDRRVAIGPDQLTFDLRSGDIIGRFAPQPVNYVNNWIEGLHWIQFDHWPLRWLYFLAGLSGCAMIGSGLLFWIEARLSKGRMDPASVRVVRAISIGSITGIIVATCAFLIANRLLPKVIGFTDVPRHEIEIGIFFGTWFMTFAHAALRRKKAWRDQSIFIAVGAGAAVLLNWLTTGMHPVAAIDGAIWPVAAMDALLLGGAAFAVLAARRLGRSGQGAVTDPARPREESDIAAGQAV
ncbi:MAG: PepSY domain-containing protein [Sphingopyxis sp.]|uniref:PepSY-associated TM helix domain-containing protein n=1 Tax=Sphingopyxis sp. TaxID=1908224 RepID=UPI001A4F283A|nr:PepSY-associated TM helix domain-containing protein [Sphingopyxis sp.]MBL9071371.1 PepSY domain-containing protein [Sphingopyxis sp.]